MTKMNKKGFTLIEMLVVIAIIAVLVSIVVPTVSKSTAKAAAATDAANLRSMASTIAIDYLDNDTVDGSYTAPVCKTNKDWDMKVYVVNGEVKAYFVSTDKYYDVAAFAAVADGTATTLTPVTTAPSGNAIYSAS